MEQYTDDMGQEENEHIIHLWEPLEFNIDEKYKYVKKGIIFSFFSNLLYYGIAFPVLKLITKIIYDLKIEGLSKTSVFYFFSKNYIQIMYQVIQY